MIGLEQRSHDGVDGTMSGKAETEVFEVLGGDVETDFFKLNLLRFVWGLRFFCHRIVEEPSALGTISTLG